MSLSGSGFGFDDEDDDDEDKLTITHGTGNDDGDDSEFGAGLPEEEEDDRPEIELLVDTKANEVTLFEIDATEQECLGDEIAESWITVSKQDAVDIPEAR